MSHPSLPRILAPNLGCPDILSPEALHEDGFDVLVATSKKDGPPGPWTLQAIPSCAGDGVAFDPVFDAMEAGQALPKELTDDSLPEEFPKLASTRRLVSTTLRSVTFDDKARFWIFRARTAAVLDARHFRRGKPLPTLYDLELRHGNECLHRVPHAFCLRDASKKKVEFAHVTDLHVAERNDLWAREYTHLISPPPATKFVNFNEHLRRFIRWANDLADRGQLDLVLALGDLVDFVKQGITELQAAPNNWQLFVEILTGGGDEAQRGNPGLRVPFFTTLGNHDWRGNPYPPETEAEIFGLTKKEAEQLDYVYRDHSEAVGKRIRKVHDRLVKEGSPILAHSWWHTMVSFGLRGVEVLADRIMSRFWAWANSSIRYAFYALAAATVGGLGITGLLGRAIQNSPRLLRDALVQHPVLSIPCVLIAVALGWFGLALLRTMAGNKLRRLVQGLIAIEKSLPNLRDYFVLLNPYFNYAFEVGNCYFLVLDTGHDCLTAQSFWDEGGKKIERLSLGDNIIGGSPDTMGFFPPNVHFPYGQIAWMERALRCIQKATGQKVGAPRTCRVFIGVHSPAANLSAADSARASDELGTDDSMLLPRPESWADRGYDVCYGTINHYLSQFYYLCLGVREGATDMGKQHLGCGVDVVLSGHAHWCQEFKLAKPRDAQAPWKPEIHWGRLSAVVERAYAEREDAKAPADWFGPLLLQTAGCGPRCLAKGHEGDDQPPYVRLITVEPDLWVSGLKQVRVL